jgi:hypothetical protein
MLFPELQELDEVIEALSTFEQYESRPSTPFWRRSYITFGNVGAPESRGLFFLRFERRSLTVYFSCLEILELRDVIKEMRDWLKR